MQNGNEDQRPEERGEPGSPVEAPDDISGEEGHDLCCLADEPFAEVEGETVEQLEKLRAGYGQVCQNLSGMAEEVAELKSLVQSLEQNQSALAQANEAISKLSDIHYEERVIQPMAGLLFPLFDFVVDCSMRRRKEGKKGAQYRKYVAIKNMLDDFFGVFGVEHFVPQSGAAVDPQEMRVVRVKNTEDEKLHNHVQSCRKVGFRRGANVLRAASVVMWKAGGEEKPPNSDKRR